MDIDSINDDFLSSKEKRKKYFGPKIKLTEWEERDEESIKEEEDILDYIQKESIINVKTIKQRINVPEAEYRKFLNCILKTNPMLNIRKRDKDYLLRIKIKRRKITKKFNTLKQAQDLRNLLLLYSMSNDPKFQMHLLKRNRISEANKKKRGEYEDNYDDDEEDSEEDDE